MPVANDLVCSRCNTRLLAESAVTVVIEVVIADRVIERLQFFDFHPACAKLAADPELRKRRVKHRERDAEIRWSLEPAR